MTKYEVSDLMILLFKIENVTGFGEIKKNK
jgi:hypothetical protein